MGQLIILRRNKCGCVPMCELAVYRHFSLQNPLISPQMPDRAGKAVARGYPGHYLPVVAMGSLPHTDRRAAFPHRATPNSLPHDRAKHLLVRVV